MALNAANSRYKNHRILYLMILLYLKRDKMKKITLILAVIALFTGGSYAQISQGGMPYSFSGNNNFAIPRVEIDVTQSKHLNSTRNISKSEANPTPEPVIGELFPVNMTPSESGKWNQLPNGDKLWQLNFSSTKGKAMMLIFDDFFIPEGGQLFVYSSDKRQILGAFTSTNNTPQNKFSTAPIEAQSIVIEYYHPAGSPETYRLSIQSVGILKHTPEDISRAFGDSGSCMINAKCSQYEVWCNQRRSVAMIIRVLSNGGTIRWCTGSMVTNEKRDGKPYFLTAFHCLDNGTDGEEDKVIDETEKAEVNNWIFVFNYQSPNCNNPSVEPTTMYSISGATYINAHYKTDYALLQLSHRPPKDYNVHYNGWDNRNDAPEDGVCIHHPRGDIKKISSYEKARKNTITDWFYPGKNWKLKWEEGSTEPGSSGAPLFNSEGRTVGQLQGGGASCDGGLFNSDYFGRFDKSWHEYGLSWNLNPNGTHSGSSTYYISSMSGDEPCKVNWYFANGNDLHTSNNVSFTSPGTVGTRMYDGVYNAQNNITAENVTIKTATSVTFEAGVDVILQPGFNTEDGSSFTAQIGNCERGCGNGYKSSTIAGSDQTGDMIISTTPYVDDSPDNARFNRLDQIGQEIKIYPNPNDGNFYLDLPFSKEEVIKVQIVDHLGKTIFESSLGNNNSINIPNPENGIYFVSVVLKDQTLTQKIMIQQN